MSTPETAKILVVDDAPVVRLYHRHILEQAGYEVAEAENGLVAIEMALQGAFDLAIVDVNMPVMDGYAFMHRLRATSGISAMPALMISTEATAQDRARAVEAGANAYLVKPVTGADCRAVRLR
jgi:two-component system chemotaxis response regulator CheY